jgi:uncharacterized membrane protein
MVLLLLGLALFLGPHSIRIFAEQARTRLRAKVGENAYKSVYSLVSLAGMALVSTGYAATREGPTLFSPPVWTRHLAWLLTLASFVLFTAAYMPGTRIKAAVKHPMVVGVNTWALAHLAANGRLGDVVLFGALVAWAVLDFRAARKRDRATGTTYPAKPGFAPDLVAVAVGAGLWFVFAKWLHLKLIGVYPFL